jgi:phosphotransferase system enzyme I (PtsI)
MSGHVGNLKGIGVSPGVAVGPVRKVINVVSTDAISASPREIFEALVKVGEDLDRAAATIELDVAKEVLSAQSMIAQDPALVEAIGARLDQDIKYPDVRADIVAAFAGFKEALLAIGGYFAERAADLDEICNRLLAKLSGTESEGLVLTSPTVIVAEDLTPADTASLNLKYALALVVEKGGPTSHTAIVARGLGIPAIVGCSGVMQLAEGINIMADGRTGEVITSPDEATIHERQVREDALRARAASVTGPGRLSDGTPVKLLANCGDGDGSVAAISAGAEGIGLFRTELLFLDSITEPTVEEQIQMYRTVFTPMVGKRVVVRTLDAGSDKPVPYINAIHEENPALGVRGWRLTRTSDGVLSRQLEAIAEAAKGIEIDLWVMAPMINTPAEAADFAKRARELGIKQVGVMVETPAAAIHADKVLAEVDFGSFGTNDLTQYVMASDRLDSRLSDMTSTWHPAVLRVIQIAAGAASHLIKPIGVCGEAAANPHLAAVLLGLGVNSLSMAPSAISEVRGFLSTVDIATCQTAALRAIAATSAEEAEQFAKEILEGAAK